jgi:hypothetical protein
MWDDESEVRIDQSGELGAAELTVAARARAQTVQLARLSAGGALETACESEFVIIGRSASRRDRRRRAGSLECAPQSEGGGWLPRRPRSAFYMFAICLPTTTTTKTTTTNSRTRTGDSINLRLSLAALVARWRAVELCQWDGNYC